ncbi:MAG: nitroreductase family protein [Schleiferiaceae bacterium]|nr:nitroreductase family protein [Schleiferiaceae bacterium]
MEFKEAVQYRRSVRAYKPEPIDAAIVQQCLELATLAPNSSNMQLWEFYHITDPTILKPLAAACLGQGAATTAQQMVVFVTRQDLYKQRAKAILNNEITNIQQHSPTEKQASRIQKVQLYYGKLMPFLYSRFLGILGGVRKLLVNIVGLFRPITYQVSEGDMRVVVHKTCALAAQTFMLAMADAHYDTCPMEGFDSRKVKRLLQLPRGAEVNMVVSCGIREPHGVWGARRRVPFEEVYKRK